MDFLEEEEMLSFSSSLQPMKMCFSVHATPQILFLEGNGTVGEKRMQQKSQFLLLNCSKSVMEEP